MIYIIALILLFTASPISADELPSIYKNNSEGIEEYIPPPFIFVHGINSSGSMWQDAYVKIRPLLENADASKTPKYRYATSTSGSAYDRLGIMRFETRSYMPVFDYRDNTHDSLISNGALLTNRIVNGLNNYEWYGTDVIALDEENKNQVDKRKVTLVGHSMGSLLSRYAVKDTSINNRIYKITSIGAPNLGSAMEPCGTSEGVCT